VTFIPPAVGTFSGAVTIADNAPGSPQAVSLAGTGLHPCLFISNALTATVLRGTPSAQFVISDHNPSCHTHTLTLGCLDNAPASCAFNPAAIPPTGKSTLTVGNLTALPTDTLKFTAIGTSGTLDQSGVALAVQLADFFFTSFPAAASVPAGETASYSVSVSPVNGLAGTVQLACEGAPIGASCTVSPSTVTLDGSSPAQVSVSVTTTPRSHAYRFPGPGLNPPGLGGRLREIPWGFVALLMALAAGLLAEFSLSERKSRSFAWPRTGRCRASLRMTGEGLRMTANGVGLSGLVLAMTLLLVLVWVACGGGGGGPVSSNRPAGTPIGSYLVTVSGTYTPPPTSQASSLTHSTTLTLNVN